MSENLIFSQLMNKLDHTQEQVLYLLSHFNVPVQPMALTQQLIHVAQNQANTNQPNILSSQINEALKMLHAYTLIEMSQSQENNRVYVYVTPIVKGLIRIDQPDSLLKECASELRFSHQVAGQYFYGLYQNQSVDGVSELSEAFDHFYLAKDQDKLNEIGNRLANFYYKSSYFQTALTYCQKVEQACGEAIDKIFFYNQLGVIYRIFGEYDAALSYFEKALLIVKEKADRQAEGFTLNNIGAIYHAGADFETALCYLEQSLEIFREIGDSHGVCQSLNNIGMIHKERGAYETALRYFEQSLEICREIDERRGEGFTLNNICTIYNARGDYETALLYLEQSLEIHREIGDRQGEAQSLNNFCVIYKARGDYETALRYLEQSLEIRREIGDRQGEGTTLNNISQIHDAQGDYETALRYLEQSLEISREIGYRSGMCMTLINMGHIHYQNNDQENAMIHWVKSYRIAKEIGYAQALLILENGAKQLGGNDLSFWDAIAEKIESSIDSGVSNIRCSFIDHCLNHDASDDYDVL